MSLESLPYDLHSLILDAIPSPRDLLQLALAAKKWSSLIIPNHIEYRVLRLRFHRAEVWKHLADNAHLAGGIRDVVLGPQFMGVPSPSACSAAFPYRFPESALDESGYDDDDDDEGGSLDSQWAEPARATATRERYPATLVGELSDETPSEERVADMKRDIRRAFANMRALEAVRWEIAQDPSACHVQGDRGGPGNMHDDDIGDGATPKRQHQWRPWSGFAAREVLSFLESPNGGPANGQLRKLALSDVNSVVFNWKNEDIMDEEFPLWKLQDNRLRLEEVSFVGNFFSSTNPTTTITPLGQTMNESRQLINNLPCETLHTLHIHSTIWQYPMPPSSESFFKLSSFPHLSKFNLTTNTNGFLAWPTHPNASASAATACAQLITAFLARHPTIAHLQWHNDFHLINPRILYHHGGGGDSNSSTTPFLPNLQTLHSTPAFLLSVLATSQNFNSHGGRRPLRRVRGLSVNEQTLAILHRERRALMPALREVGVTHFASPGLLNRLGSILPSIERVVFMPPTRLASLATTNNVVTTGHLPSTVTAFLELDHFICTISGFPALRSVHNLGVSVPQTHFKKNPSATTVRGLGESESSDEASALAVVQTMISTACPSLEWVLLKASDDDGRLGNVTGTLGPSSCSESPVSLDDGVKWMSLKGEKHERVDVEG